MSRTAFGGRELGEAFAVLRAMADDPACTRVVTISGAMTVGKMGLVLCEMIEAGLAQMIVCTGAVMAHGLSEAIGCTHYKHDPRHSDRQLYEWGYNRVYDTLEMEANLWHAQELVGEVFAGLRLVAAGLFVADQSRVGPQAGRKGPDAQHPRLCVSPRRAGLCPRVHRFGTRLGRGGLLAQSRAEAGRRRRPGGDLFSPAAPSYNPFLDLYDYTRRIHQAERIGVFTVGGGVPRNWAQQVGPFSDIINMRLGESLPVAAVPLRRPPLSRARPLGRTERLHLHRRRLLGEVPQRRGRADSLPRSIATRRSPGRC